MVTQKSKFRHELKYYINYIEHLKLKNILKHILKRDKNSDSEGIYHIRSLYFDDGQDSALYEKNYGILQRKKYRIRIYNQQDEIIKLEIKIKQGEFVNKISSKITKDEYYKILKGDIAFLKGRDTTSNYFYTAFEKKQLQPKIIVDYIREAYVYTVSDVRITFDKNLSCAINTFDIFSTDIVNNAILYQNDNIVMEVKFNEFLPDHIRNTLSFHSYRRAAVSKYVLSRLKKNNIY